MKTSTLLLLTLLTAGLQAQQPKVGGADPYAEPPAKVESAAEGRANLSLCYEIFSLPLADAAAYRRERITDTELYDRLLEKLETGGVKQEHFSVLRGRSGEKFTSHAVIERIYPTEYEPPELPNTVGVGVAARNAEGGSETPDPTQLAEAPPVASVEGLSTPATPTAFETRNEGATIEAAPVLTTSENLVDLNSAFEQITHIGESVHGRGLAETSMPMFESCHFNNGVTPTLNRPFLLGTLNRPPKSKVDPDSANKVRFAFVTVTLIRP